MSNQRLETLDEYIRLQGAVNDHQVRAVIWLKGRLDVERLRRCVDVTLDRIPVLGSRHAPGGHRAVWFRETDRTVRDYFRVIDEPLADSCLIARLQETPDQDRGPQVLVTVVRGESDDILIITVNHMAFDGHGLKSYLYLLSQLYSAPDPAGWADTADICLERRLSVLLSNVSLRRRLASLPRTTIAFDPKGGPLTEDHRPVRARLGMLVLSDSDYRAIRYFCREQDLTVNDLVLALLCQAVFEENRVRPPAGELTVQMMIDLRRHVTRHLVSDFGNFSSMESIQVRGPNGAFLDLAREIRSQTKAVKEHDPGIKNVLVLDALYRLLPRRAFGRTVSRAIRSLGISTSNLGVVDESRVTFGTVGIERLALLTSLKNQPAMQLTFSTFRDQMTLTVLGMYSDANWAVLERLLNRIGSGARRLACADE